MEIPLIYTIKGNLPIESLKREERWEVTPTYIKFVETYKLNNEVVRESCHIYGGVLTMEAKTGKIS